MKKKVELYKIFGFGLVGSFVLLAIICIISHIATYNYSTQGLINCILIIVVCAILSLIFGLIFRVFSKPNKEPQQEDSDEIKKIKEEAKEIDARSEKLLSGYDLKALKKEVKSYKVKKERPLKPYEEKILEESRERLTIREKLKNIAIGFLIFIICGAGYIPLSYFGITTLNNLKSDEYVKVEATVKRVNQNLGENSSSLVYTYSAEDGLTYISNNGATFGGAIFKEGKTVTAYYKVSNPEELITLSETILMFFGAAYFFIVGLAVFINFCGRNDGLPVLFGICSVFIILPAGLITGIQLAGGLSFFELLGSGAFVYALLSFIVIGLLLLTYSIYCIIHKARLIAKYKYKV